MLPHLSTFSSPLCPAATSAIGQRSCRPTSRRCGGDTRRTPGLFLCTSSPGACRGASLPHSAKARKVALQSGSLPIQRQKGQLTPSAIWPRRSIWRGTQWTARYRNYTKEARCRGRTWTPRTDSARRSIACIISVISSDVRARKRPRQNRPRARTAKVQRQRIHFRSDLT